MLVWFPGLSLYLSALIDLLFQPFFFRFQRCLILPKVVLLISMSLCCICMLCKNTGFLLFFRFLFQQNMALNRELSMQLQRKFITWVSKDQLQTGTKNEKNVDPRCKNHADTQERSVNELPALHEVEQLNQPGKINIFSLKILISNFIFFSFFKLFSFL